MAHERVADKGRLSVRVGYVLKRYPRLSETFIVQEILQMEARGADLVLFPIMDPHESIQNPAITRVRAPIYYVQRSFLKDLPGMVRSHFRLLLRRPVGYARAVGHLLRGTRSRASLRAFMQAGRLADLALQQGVDHLHAHFAHNPASLARYASIITGIPYSFTAHAKDLYLSRRNSLVNKAEIASFITTCTGFNARYLREVLPADLHEKVHVVYHGVDTARFAPPSTPRAPHATRVLAVGRLVPKKGYEVLIDAARILHTRGIVFRLDIYGGGELRDALQRQIGEAGIAECVKLHGVCTQEDLVQLYRDSDVFALSPMVTENGDRDGIPNVLLEAMASGLAPVSTHISGIPELISHGRNGLLVPPGDPVALADALSAVLLEPALRDRLSVEARATVVRHFEAGANVSRLAALLDPSEEIACAPAMS